VRRLVKDYYIRRTDGMVFPVKGRRKELLVHMGPHQEAMRAYMDDVSADLYDPVSLRKLIDHYATLCTTASTQP